MASPNVNDCDSSQEMGDCHLLFSTSPGIELPPAKKLGFPIGSIHCAQESVNSFSGKRCSFSAATPTTMIPICLSVLFDLGYFLGGSWETQTMFFMSTQKCIAIGSEQNPGNTPGVLHRPRSDRPPFQLSVSFGAKLCRLTSWIVNRRQPCRCHPESKIFELIWPAYMTANKAWLSTKIGRRKPVVKRCPKK